MMLKIENFSYRYGGRKEKTLKNINLHLPPGEMLLLAGPSGCGKSTLIKAVTGILQSEGRGEFSGRILLDGKDALLMTPEEIGMLAGTIYQTPDDQLFAMTVRDEVAFALENQGMEEAAVDRQVGRTLALVGLQGMEGRSIYALSGGQRQRLALASVLVTQPRVLILDEPVSQMNPQGAREFMELLAELNRSRGLTVLMIEHRVNELSRYFKRIAVMRDGGIIYDGPMENVWNALGGDRCTGLREPQTVRLCRMLNLPAVTDDADKTAQMIRECCAMKSSAGCFDGRKAGSCLLEVKNLYFRYEGARQDALRDVSFEVRPGEAVALMGFNGAGKSTLLNIIGGLSRQSGGTVLLQGEGLRKNMFRIGYLRQEADLMLLADTVSEELLWNNKLLDREGCRRILRSIGLAGCEEDFPLALSKGQRLRVVLSAVLARRPLLLLLDEPTTGQDQRSLEAIKIMLKDYLRHGGSVFFCTHDIELAADLADRVIVLADGRILADGSVTSVLGCGEFLSRGGLTVPPMLDISRQLGLSACITAEEVSRYVSKAAMGGQ